LSNNLLEFKFEEIGDQNMRKLEDILQILSLFSMFYWLKEEI